MYTGWAEQYGHKVEVLSQSDSDLEAGEVVFVVKAGRLVAAQVRGWRAPGSSGPVTESQLHPPPAGANVAPEADPVEVTVDPTRLKIDVYWPTGPGGQSVNSTRLGGAHHPLAVRHRGRDGGREVL